MELNLFLILYTDYSTRARMMEAEYRAKHGKPKWRYIDDHVRAGEGIGLRVG